MRVVVVRGSGQSVLGRARPGDARPGEARDGEETVAGLLALSDDEASAAIDEYQQGFTWLRDPRFVSIAAVQGYAIGAGFQLALSCDLRVLAEDAQLCMKESALGLVPDLTGTKPLVETRRLRTGAGDLRDRPDGRRPRRRWPSGSRLTAVPADRARRDGRRPGRGADRPARRAR